MLSSASNPTVVLGVSSQPASFDTPQEYERAVLGAAFGDLLSRRLCLPEHRGYEEAAVVPAEA